MDDETTHHFKKRTDSHILSLSTRACIVLMICGTVCYMSLIGLKVEEPLYTLVGLTVGYYFGQNQKPQQHPNK